MLLRPRPPLFARRAALIAVFALAASVAQAQTQPAPAASPAQAPVAAPAPGTPVPGAAAPVPGAVADPYTVTGIKVDVSADNANLARDRAIAQAQSKAWAELVRRLAPGGDAGPALSDGDLMRVVQGVMVDDERVTPTRYIASISVRFRADAVRNHFAGSNAQYAEPPGRAYVVLPVTTVGGKPVLWEDRTPWRDAWEGRTTGSLVPMTVPPGELPDVSAISAAEAVAADPAAIDRILRKYNAPGVIVVRTALPPAGQPLPASLTVEVSRLDANGERKDQTVGVRKDPDDRPEDLVRRAVIQTSAAIDDLWRQGNTIVAGPEQNIVLTLAIASLPDWLEAKQRLAGTGGVTGADLISLGRTSVKLSLVYRGDVASLRQQLAKRDLALDDKPGASGQYQLRLLPRGSGGGAVAPAGAMRPIGPAAVNP